MAFKLRSGRGIAAIAGATLALGGAGAAIGLAAGGGLGGDDGRQAFADALSDRVGAEVTVEDLQAARQEAAKSRLDEAVQEGRLTQDEADQMLERIQQEPQRRVQKREAREALVAPVAKALGVGAEELREAKRDGTTLLELAQQNNVSRADLEAAVKDGLEAGAAMTGRDLPEGQELEDRVDRIVESDGPPPGRGGHGPRGFFRGP
jgi:hypothetical protein